MRIPLIICCASATLLGLAACIMPPSMYERATWGPPSESWQEQGRYRQAERAPEPEPVRAPELARPKPGPSYSTSVDPYAELPESVQVPTPEPPLYGWDGGVVDGAPQGRVSEQEGTPRGLETPPAGRMHIIELYQQVLDERDALASEVEILRKGLEETSLALEAKTKESLDLGAQVASLEAAHAGLMSDNRDIAARLVQAQIRRLESEKLLLETRIEIERAKSEEAALAAAARPGEVPSKSATGKPKEPPKAHAKEHE